MNIKKALTLITVLISSLTLMVGGTTKAQAQSDEVELLPQPWHLQGSYGAAELYQGIDPYVLGGKDTLKVTIDLHGLCPLGGDASALIFDQNGWQYVSLSSYAQGCLDGEQTIEIPLSDFTNLNPETSVGTLHTRFWYNGVFTVDITSIIAYNSQVATPAPTPTPTPKPSPSGGSGSVLLETWNNITGTQIANLIGNGNYPDNPSTSGEIPSFEAPTNVADNYGQRIHGYLHPPESGYYEFWVAGDDESQLWLSTDSNPSNEVLIARVPGWTNSREWTKYSEQLSELIWLDSSQAYYIKALMKEAGGGDNLAASWKQPNGTQEIIPGTHLSPYGVSPNPTPTPSPTPTPFPTPTPTPTPIPPSVGGTELLTQTWQLQGNNGAAEAYQSIEPNVLEGVNTIRVSIDLNGLEPLGGDASALIFDQNGWQYVSLSGYVQGGINDIQTIDIPLSDFTNLDLNEPVGTLHIRFWYGSEFVVNITSVFIFSSQSPTPTPIPTPTPTPESLTNDRIGMDLGAYCSSIGMQSVNTVGSYARDWVCEDAEGYQLRIDMSLVCLWQDGGSHPFAALDDPNNLYSWSCNSLPQPPWLEGSESPLTIPYPSPTPTPTPVPTIPPPPLCPAGTGPNGIVAGSYPPQRLTQDERQWLYEIFGNSGTASVGYGGEECGESYFDSNLNFFAMVCSWNHTGPGNLKAGSYPPQNLTQEQRQWLYDEFRAGSDEAPVGYGGEHCPQYGDKTSWEVHIEEVCASGAIGPGIVPGDYIPQELTQEQRQWLWDTFGEFGDDSAPVGYGGHACPGQTEHYHPIEERIISACNSGGVSSTGIKPKGYAPQDLTQEERQWLWNTFQEGSGDAPVGYGGQMCTGQTELGDAQADRDAFSSGGGSTGVGSQVCPSAPARLKLGDIAVVAVSGLNVRENPRLSAQTLFTLSYGELITIVSGPSCSDGMLWWQIGTSIGTGGFVPAMSSEGYSLISHFGAPPTEYETVLAMSSNPNTQPSETNQYYAPPEIYIPQTLTENVEAMGSAQPQPDTNFSEVMFNIANLFDTAFDCGESAIPILTMIYLGKPYLPVDLSNEVQCFNGLELYDELTLLDQALGYCGLYAIDLLSYIWTNTYPANNQSELNCAIAAGHLENMIPTGP